MQYNINHLYVLTTYVFLYMLQFYMCILTILGKKDPVNYMPSPFRNRMDSAKITL